METRNYREHTHNYYEDENARHYPPRRRNRIQTIRLLTESAETILDHGRRRLNDFEDRFEDNFSSHQWRPPPRQSNFIGVFPIIRNLLLYGSIATVLLLLSIGEFGFVYVLTLPGLTSNEILHFDYTGSGIATQVLGQPPLEPTMVCDETETNSTIGSCSSSSTTTTTTNSNSTNPVFPTRITSLNPLQNYEIDQTYRLLWQTAPVAVVDLRANHDGWQHYHPEAIPAFQKDERILKAGAPHFVEVVLDLPESQTNLQDIGIFSVVVELRSADNENSIGNSGRKLLASSTRTARMPHESNWISVIRKFVCLFLHLSGAFPEQRTIVVPVYRFFVETKNDPLRYISVRLLVSPETARKGAMVEVTSGKVRIGEEPTGLRLLLKDYFLVCAIVFTAIFFGMQSMMVLILQLCWWNRQNQAQHDDPILDNVSEGLGLDGLDDNSDGAFESIHANGNENNPQRQNEDNGNEEDQWEDLPQETTEGNDSQPQTDAGDWATSHADAGTHNLIPDLDQSVSQPFSDS